MSGHGLAGPVYTQQRVSRLTVNLLAEGLHRILLEMIDSYTGFAPLGIVMVAMLGIGVAESSGLIGTGVKALLV